MMFNCTTWPDLEPNPGISGVGVSAKPVSCYFLALRSAHNCVGHHQFHAFSLFHARDCYSPLFDQFQELSESSRP